MELITSFGTNRRLRMFSAGQDAYLKGCKNGGERIMAASMLTF
jgi:hypothetical protein